MRQNSYVTTGQLRQELLFFEERVDEKRRLQSQIMRIDMHIIVHSATSALEKKINFKLVSLDKRMIQLEDKMVNLDQRIVNLEQKMINLEGRVIKLEDRITNLEQRMENLEQKMINIEQKIDKRFDQIIDILKTMQQENKVRDKQIMALGLGTQSLDKRIMKLERISKAN